MPPWRALFTGNRSKHPLPHPLRDDIPSQWGALQGLGHTGADHPLPRTYIAHCSYPKRYTICIIQSPKRLYRLATRLFWWSPGMESRNCMRCRCGHNAKKSWPMTLASSTTKVHSEDTLKYTSNQLKIAGCTMGYTWGSSTFFLLVIKHMKVQTKYSS